MMDFLGLIDVVSVTQKTALDIPEIIVRIISFLSPKPAEMARLELVSSASTWLGLRSLHVTTWKCYDELYCWNGGNGYPRD